MKIGMKFRNMKMPTKFWLEVMKRKCYSEDLSVDEMTILKLTFTKEIGLIWLRMGIG
jgi:hypothetical protein